MKVLIRTDSSIQIGTGHVMRCLTLANMLQKKGAQVIFICRELKGNIIEHIRNEGFEVFKLSNIHSTSHWSWTSEYWREDVQETITFLQRLTNPIDMVIVDHYALDFKWERKIRPYTEKVMVIDDLADRNHDADLLLNQNFHLCIDNLYDGLVPKHCKLFLGPKYVLLREEFFAAAINMPLRKNTVERILVFFGGTDPTNETEKTLHALKKLSKTYKFRTDVIVGITNPKKSAIEKLCSEIPGTYFNCQVDNMAEMMTKADLAIGAGGSVTWERCFLKLPCITIVVADNQEKVSLDVAKTGASIVLGKSRFVESFDIEEAVEKVIKEPVILKQLSINCGKLIDTDYILNNSLVSEIVEILK